MNKQISSNKIRTIYELVLTGIVNKRRVAIELDITRNTLKRYISTFKTLIILYPDKLDDFEFLFDRLKKPIILGQRFIILQNQLETISHNIRDNNSTILLEWAKYKEDNPEGYNKSQFNSHLTSWCNENRIPKLTNRWRISNISFEDFITLNKWRRSSNRLKWEIAVTIMGAKEGESLAYISQKIERTKDKIKEWIRAFSENGLEGLKKKPRKRNENIIQLIESKKNNLMILLHETPKLHGINRASWSLITLAEAYKKKYNESIGTTTISDYIRKEGYSFKKAREKLTSPDPNFREKLSNITKILSNLSPKEKFFSVDEFGPFAVKIKGGRSYVKNSETKIYPQLQRSKGCIICTAALELSENQVSHFYSLKKNTDEMIKLLEILIEKYKDDEKIYFSWDAASWHASKILYKKIEEVNSDAYRIKNKTPLVELAPLPSSAQFLNVIESVFSGLAKGIIHNSDYGSSDECKSAIDNYFKERNEHFLKNPKRAGNKIWGKELVIPIFDKSNNCKDPKWR